MKQAEAATSMQPEILHRQSELVTGAWRDVYVESVRAPFDLELVRLSNRLQRDASNRPGLQRMVVVSVFHHGLTLPSAEVRALAAETMALLGPMMRASAGVLLQPGFSSAIFRSAFVAVTLVQPPPFPATMVGSLADACRFVLPHVESAPSFQTLLDVVTAIDAAAAKVSP